MDGRLRMPKLSGDDFDESTSKGALILGVNTTSITCNQVCSERGLSCSWDSSGSNCTANGSVSRRYCWCQ